MLTKLSLRFLDRVPKEDHDKILKDRFFYGIKSELRISIRHLYDDDSVTFSQLLVKAHRNEEEESASWIINKKMTMENDSTLEQQVDRLIAKFSNQYQAPHSPTKRDNSQNYGRPPFQANFKSKGDYRQAPKCPPGDIRQNLRGLKPSAAGPFWEADGSQPIQCFRCRGWGHPKRLCPSHLNYTQGGMVWDNPSQTMDQTPEGPLPRTHLLNNRYENIANGQEIP